jgi:hypothetical protein
VSAPGRHPPPRSAPAAARPSRAGIPALLALGVLVLSAIGLDVSRIGFFADDFHFLDIARRVPLLTLLTGQHGMWPWFRPLSRELYFKAVVLAEPASLAAAHALSLACVAACAWQLWRIGRRVTGAPAGAIAAVLFVSYGFTKFLAAWPSGFQDLLAMLLVLGSVLAHLGGRRRLALAVAFLAPFAKEPAVVVFPILVACEFLLSDRRPGRAWWLGLLAAAGGALFLHLAARATWVRLEWAPRESVEPERMMVLLEQVVGGFLGPLPVAAIAAATTAVVSAAAAAWFLHRASRPDAGAGEPPVAAGGPRGIAFAAAAALIGTAPVVGGHLLSLTYAHAYHFYPATPWIALLLAAAIARLLPFGCRVAVPLLVAWNAWGSGFRPTDVDRPEGWGFHRWDWPQASRFSAQTHRLADDVRRELANRPESLVVLYEGLPGGAFFQTEDGPATREALRDPTVRAYWINDPPPVVRPDRLAILAFDLERLHLRRVEWSESEVILRATKAILGNRGRVANALARFGADPGARDFDRAYLGAAASLIETGPEAFVLGLADAGLGDTLGAAPDSLARPLASADPGLGAAFARMLGTPRSAGAHADLADSLLSRGVVPGAGVELRIAVRLDPARWADRYRMARVMIELGGHEEARIELARIAAEPAAGAVRVPARATLARLPPEPSTR